MRPDTITFFAFLSLAAPGLAAGAPCGPVLDIADDFSGVQGQHGWFYGYSEEGGPFTLMTVFTGTNWFVDPSQPPPQYWTRIGSFSMHPNGRTTGGGRTSIDHEAILRWVAPAPGTVRCEGFVKQTDTAPNGNGEDWFIRHNGVQIFAGYVAAGDTTGLTYDIEVNVAAGDSLDFALNSHNSNDIGDGVLYAAKITTSLTAPEYTSTQPSLSKYIAGEPATQIATLNAPPSPLDGSWVPVNRQSDNHTQTFFTCFVPTGIVGTTGEMEVVSPPPSVEFDVYESNTHIRVFEERTAEPLPSDLTVDFSEPGLYDELADLPPGGVVLAAGTPVMSHLLHFDTVGSDERTRTGSVTFDSDVLGVSLEANALDASDSALGAPGTVYPTGMPRRAWEIGGTVGEIDLSADRRTVTVTGIVDQWSDQVRVLTASNATHPLSQPYVNSTSYLAGVDEVTLDNCGSAWYRFTFDMPPAFENAVLCGAANVDDVGLVYLNGVRLSPELLLTDTFGTDRSEGGTALLSAPTPDLFGTSDNSFFTPGTNELVFGVFGDAAPEPTGLEFQATVAFDSLDVVSVEEVPAATQLFLGPVRPNPSRAALTFLLSLPEAGDASVKVFNIQGRLVDTAFEGRLSAGPHEVAWNPGENGLAAGIYYLRLNALGQEETQRFVLVR